jgi:hypothetical protein
MPNLSVDLWIAIGVVIILTTGGVYLSGTIHGHDTANTAYVAKNEKLKAKTRKTFNEIHNSIPKVNPDVPYAGSSDPIAVFLLGHAGRN